MLRDKQSMFSEEQAVTVTADSTNVLFVGEGNDIDKQLRLFVQAREAATADGAGTVTVKLYTGATAAACSTLLWTSAVIGKAACTAGAFIVKMALPDGILDYLKLTYTVATGPLTAGTFDAGLIWKMDEH